MSSLSSAMSSPRPAATAPERAARTLADPRWQDVLRRNPQADGRFFYSVRSTGVFCRPSCAARTPRPENVAFHANPAEARAAGFRACKRCKPEQRPLREQNATLIEQLCRVIESAEQPPKLQELAEQAGMSAFHLHRVFKAVTGVTPKAYADAHRARRMQAELRRGGQAVTEAIHAAGFAASSRFYEAAPGRLGMTPSRYKAGGAQTRIRFAIGACSLGSLLVAASPLGLCAILLGDDPQALVRDLQDRFPKAELLGGDADFEAWMAQVVGFVDEPWRGLDLPLDVRGTAFQQRVWQALQRVPSGTTVSYAEVAERIGAPRAVRAVAGACAANPLAVAIPCHRVVRTDGAVSGYRWGVERKRTLLACEAGHGHGTGA